MADFRRTHSFYGTVPGFGSIRPCYAISIILHLPQMVNQQHSNIMLIRKRLKRPHFPIVSSIGPLFSVGGPSDALERINDDQAGVRVLFQKTLQFIKQAIIHIM